MAASLIPSSKSDGKCHIRSVSLPCRSHPSTLQLESELNNLRSLETSSSDTICSSLSTLDKLYNCMDDVLSLNSTIEEPLSHKRNEQCINELLNRSLELLDVCRSTREAMFQIKEHVRDLQSAMRRRRGDLERSMAKYISFRKKMKKDAKKLIASLKQQQHDGGNKFEEHDHHLPSLVRVLKEVTMVNISVLESLLLLVSAPAGSNSTAAGTKWSMVIISRLMIKKGGHVASEDHLDDDDLNDFSSVDSALCGVLCKGNNNKPCRPEELCSEKMQLVHKKMVALESGIEGIEKGLECNFRRLIKTRAFFLNIISQ